MGTSGAQLGESDAQKAFDSKAEEMKSKQMKLRPFEVQEEVTDWTEIHILPSWLAVQRSMYVCECESEEDFCACLDLEWNKLPPLSDYFEKVNDEPAS